jgi:hypothetical protein
MPKLLALVNVPLAVAVALKSIRQAITRTPLVPPLLVRWMKTVCQHGSVTLSVVHPLVGTVGASTHPLR